MPPKTKLAKRDLGEACVVRVLQKHGPTPQRELAQICDLSPSAVSRIVERLFEKKLILTCENNVSLRSNIPGRPTVNIAINPTARAVLTVYVALSKIHYMLVNLDWSTEILTIDEKPQGIEVNNLVTLICKRLDGFTAVYSKKLYGYAVLLSGITDGKRGMVFNSQTLKTGISGFELKAILEQRFKLPVIVDSESNGALLGEITFNHDYLDKRNVVYVYYDCDGMVLSFYFNGKIYRGGVDTTAGQTECYAFSENTPEKCVEGRAYWLPPVGLNKVELNVLSQSKISRKVKKFGELIVIQKQLSIPSAKILENRLRMLGRGLCNIMNLLGPDYILIGGLLSELDDRYLNILHEAFVSGQLFSVSSQDRITYGKLPLLKAIAIGGASGLLTADLELQLKFDISP